MADYINRKQFRSEIKLYQSNGIVSDNLARMLMILAEHIISYKKFEKLDDEDAAAELVVIFLKVLPKLKLDANPFSYLTTCAINGLRHHYKLASNYENLIVKLTRRLDGIDRHRASRGKEHD